jgi:hypothetical protein
MKKRCMIFGAAISILIIVSSTTAVSHAQSSAVVESLNKIENKKTILNERISLQALGLIDLIKQIIQWLENLINEIIVIIVDIIGLIDLLEILVEKIGELIDAVRELIDMIRDLFNPSES